MANLTLHNLVTALANAVIEAQARVEEFQVEAVRRFFKSDGKPETLQVKLQRLGTVAASSDQDTEEQKENKNFVKLDVPLMALVGVNQLHIKEFEVEFAIQLRDLGRTVTTMAGRLNQSAQEEGESEEKAVNEKNTPRGFSHDKTNPQTHEPMLIDVQTAGSDKNSAQAKIKIKVESVQQTEGVARLLQQLYSRI